LSIRYSYRDRFRDWILSSIQHHCISQCGLRPKSGTVHRNTGNFQA